MNKILCLLALVFSSSFVVADEISPFTTDGCSAFPNGTIEQQSLWAHCCLRHDLAYWKGGTYQERTDADKALQACVSASGEPEVSEIMLAGVRVGGSPYLPTYFRWGYGWPYLRGYKALSAEEVSDVENKLESFKKMINAFNGELNNHK